MSRFRTVFVLAAFLSVVCGCAQMSAQSQQDKLTDAIVEVGKKIAEKSTGSQFTGTVTGSVVDPAYDVDFTAGVGVIGHMKISSSGVNLNGSAAVNAAATQPLGPMDMRSYDEKMSDQRVKAAQGWNAIIAGDAAGINKALADDYQVIVITKKPAAAPGAATQPAK